jgi:hypothetical protein
MTLGFIRETLKVLDLKEKAPYDYCLIKITKPQRITAWGQVSRNHVQGIFRAFLVLGLCTKGGEADVVRIVSYSL